MYLINAQVTKGIVGLIVGNLPSVIQYYLISELHNFIVNYFYYNNVNISCYLRHLSVESRNLTL